MSSGPVSRVVRAARRDALLAIVMGILVAKLFPSAAHAGTETDALRYTTAGVLVLAGALFHLGAGRRAPMAVGLLLLAVPLVFGVVWPALLGVLCAIDVGIARIRDAHRPHAVPAQAHPAVHQGEHAGEVIESIATAFVLALIVREFAFEAFKIPTGSMEPTIWGEGYGKRKGDRLLAAKAPLLLEEPKRWSIMVFRYPLYRMTNFIKRLVGMPGEVLSIRRGDIYINGRIEAKPEEVQETLWFPLFPSPDTTYRGGAAAGFVSDGVGKWSFEGTDAATGTVEAGKNAWAIFDASDPDLRVSFDLDASQLAAAGAALVRLDGDGRRVELEARRDGVWLSATWPGDAGDKTAPRIEKRKLDMGGLGGGTERLGFAVADRMVRVYRGGRLAARIETADVVNFPNGRQDHVSLGVSGGTAHFGQIRVERDLQYSDDYKPNEWKIPEGCYFMLGDNTNQSRDSRAWRGQVFRFADPRVPPVIADESPVRIDDEHAERSVRDQGDEYLVYDSFGVVRHIRKADLAAGSPSPEAQPFVRRQDLVGRAFLIFFPFPPFGEWRPRILP